jgi:hypothetical protein
MSIERRSSKCAAVHVRAIVIEDHGNDLVIEFSSPRGSTQVQVGKSEIVSVEEMARHAIFLR